MPDHLTQYWSRWMEELQQLTNFRADRCFKPPEFGETGEAQLHHFSDVSEIGYGVQKNNSNQIHCSLIVGKARVSPFKPITILQLELTAATLAVKVDTIIKKELQIPLSDSCSGQTSSLYSST